MGSFIAKNIKRKHSVFSNGMQWLKDFPNLGNNLQFTSLRFVFQTIVQYFPSLGNFFKKLIIKRIESLTIVQVARCKSLGFINCKTQIFAQLLDDGFTLTLLYVHLADVTTKVTVELNLTGVDLHFCLYLLLSESFFYVANPLLVLQICYC